MTRVAWLSALRAYLASSLGFHFVWEVAQLPLYTIWTTGTFREKAFTAVHCTLGDVVIAGLALLGVDWSSSAPPPDRGSGGDWYLQPCSRAASLTRSSVNG